jgi:NADPH2:quinone reductase
MMKAIQVNEYGGPEVMTLAELPMPEPAEAQVRVRVEAIGVNFVDVYHRKGSYPGKLPMIPGREAAGVVDALGSGVSTLQVGQRVAFATVSASYAEYVVGPANALVPVPAGVSSELAAAVMLQGMTAHYLTHSTYPLQEGDSCLVHAAAGGVGHLLVQMAKKRGARVLATVSTEEKAQVAREAGADEIIRYTEVAFDEAVRQLTNGRGVNVVYDSVGRTTFMQSMRSLQPRGYLILYGQSSGAVEPFDPQLLNHHGSLFLSRPSLHHYSSEAELAWRAGDLFRWLAEGSLHVRIDRTYPLAEAAAAHRALEGRATTGKVLLTPAALF